MNNPPEKSVLLNVCIIPPQPVGAQCVAVSQSFLSPQPMFVLGGGKFAHVTVFMARFPEDSVSAVVNSVGDIVKGQESFYCQHIGYLMTEGRYLEASYRKTKEFIALHDKLIASLSPLRMNPGKPYEEGYFTPYTAEQQENARETGYDLARQLFRPHITLTRYFENDMPKYFPAFPAVELSFDLGELCVYKADDNGAVYEQLRSFEL